MDASAAQHDRFMRIMERLLPLATLAYLIVFAWRFADERLYADSGYYLARVINEGGFRIEHGRWVLALSQLLPLAGAKLGLGMKALILLHSLNNVVWLAACMLIAWRWLRAPWAALVLCTLHLVGLTHGLFCPIFELYYGADLLILLLCVVRADHLRTATRYASAGVLLFVVASSHLFGAVLAVGALALLQIWRDRKLTALLIAVLIAQSVVHGATLSDYEKDHLSFVHKLSDPEALGLAFAPKVLIESLEYAVRHYPDALLLALFTAFVLIRQGARWDAFLFATLLFAMAALVLLKLPGFMHDRYREQVNFALVAGILITIGLKVVTNPAWRKPALLTVLLAIGYRMMQAERIAPYYAQRTRMTLNEIAQAHALGKSKIIVEGMAWFGPEHHTIDRSWSTSVESLLLSAKAGPDSTVSIITHQDLERIEVQQALDGFVFRRWDILDPGWLDPRWFTAPTGRYEPMGP